MIAAAETAAPLATRTLASPVGELTLHAGPRGLRAIRFPDSRHPPKLDGEGDASPGARPSRGASGSRTAAAILAQAARELDEYFAGRRRAFAVALDPSGTAFQREVWTALARIPFAATWSYGQLAAAIGRPSASRAVGAANGKNPLPIIVPCHRVIGQDGSLTGFGGGLPTKRWLLAHEAAIVAPPLPL
jgi:methylated-DNA-[protein]-cysteine S-methyltransferase